VIVSKPHASLQTTRRRQAAMPRQEPSERGDRIGCNSPLMSWSAVYIVNVKCKIYNFLTVCMLWRARLVPPAFMSAIDSATGLTAFDEAQVSRQFLPQTVTRCKSGVFTAQGC